MKTFSLLRNAINISSFCLLSAKVKRDITGGVADEQITSQGNSDPSLAERRVQSCTCLVQMQIWVER